jgi:lysophospholipase L1-like esterase
LGLRDEQSGLGEGKFLFRERGNDLDRHAINISVFDGNEEWMQRSLLNSVLILLLIAFARRVGVAAETRPDFADFDRRAQAGEHLSVVFFGASLTWGANATDPQLFSYRADMGHRLEKAYPHAHFTFHDGAIGGTGSQLGVFRLQRDVFRHHPDLVFLDFSANDDIHSANPETLASYEAIVRRIITEAHAPVVQVIFPFKWDAQAGNTNGMLRRDAHIALSHAYHTEVGDAIELVQKRLKDGTATLNEIWPADGVHPGNAGYEIFTDAAWTAFRKGVDDKVVCSAPEKMIYADTYMTSARVRISTLTPLPAGWHVGTANLTSAFYDMLMSRWLDDETIASNVVQEPGSKKPATKPAIVETAPLRVKFHGSMVMLFGECTSKSGKYKVIIDGKPTPRRSGDGKILGEDFDAGDFAKRCGGNVHLVQVLAQGLDPSTEHTLEIVPEFSSQTPQELRLESICVAGGKANVTGSK